MGGCANWRVQRRRLSTGRCRLPGDDSALDLADYEADCEGERNVGLAYYQLPSDKLEELLPLIIEHEAEPVGPRARGYWFDRPEEYDYEGVRATAQLLDEEGRANAIESLE